MQITKEIVQNVSPIKCEGRTSHEPPIHARYSAATTQKPGPSATDVQDSRAARETVSDPQDPESEGTLYARVQMNFDEHILRDNLIGYRCPLAVARRELPLRRGRVDCWPRIGCRAAWARSVQMNNARTAIFGSRL